MAVSYDIYDIYICHIWHMIYISCHLNDLQMAYIEPLIKSLTPQWKNTTKVKLLTCF